MQPRRSILSDETYAIIRAMIFAHEILPGNRVNIDALALQLSVSQTPIREALARLESENLISKEPMKGYRVTKLLSMKEFTDLFNFSLLIEPFAAGQAAILIDAEGIKKINDEVSSAKKVLVLRSESLINAIMEHDARFHTLVATYTGNKFLKSSFMNTNSHLHLFRIYVTSQNYLNESSEKSNYSFGELIVKQHVAVAKAIISHDSEKAKAEMHRHIESSLKRFAPILQHVQEELQPR